MEKIYSLSINDIAAEIAKQYYLVEYPSVCKEGALVFPEITTPAKRGKFGILTVCQIAALIPYIATIYIEHKADDAKQQEIENQLTEKSIKLIQAVSLMQASGRWKKPNTNPETDSNSVYLDQSIFECKKKLIALGLDAVASEHFAGLLDDKQAPNTQPYAFFYLILQDAITLIVEENPASLVDNFKFNSISNNAQIKSKFVNLAQEVTLAKTRQQAAISENETTLLPVTLSFQRMLRDLFPNFATSMAAIAEKKQEQPASQPPTVATTEVATTAPASPAAVVELDISLAAILAKNLDLSGLADLIDAFTNNADNIQEKLGARKTEYASNLFLAFEQTWNTACEQANAEFASFTQQAKETCKTEAEYLAAIDQQIKEIEDGLT